MSLPPVGQKASKTFVPKVLNVQEVSTQDAWQEAEDRQGQHGLPGPGLPDDADGLARPQGKADPPDGLDQPALGGDADVQPGDLEQRPGPGGRRALRRAGLPLSAA